MNLVVTDYVEFTLPQFTGGSFFHGRCRNAKYISEKQYAGIIERESYGRGTGQHTFSIRLSDGTLKRVEGRNLYPAVTLHREGADHAAQEAAKARRVEAAARSCDGAARVPARMRNA